LVFDYGKGEGRTKGVKGMKGGREGSRRLSTE